MPRCVAPKTRSFSKKHQIDLIFNVSKYHSHQLNESFQPDFFRNALLPTRGDDIAERGRNADCDTISFPPCPPQPCAKEETFSKTRCSRQGSMVSRGGEKPLFAGKAACRSRSPLPPRAMPSPLTGVMAWLSWPDICGARCRRSCHVPLRRGR